VTAGSTTYNKDFKVKHGLSVAEGGTFGSPVTVGTPTENAHAATKLYVDSYEFLVPASSEAPASASNGQLYIDTITNRLAFYYGAQWYTMALLGDTLEIAQHIHDTAIGGTGLITSTFVDAGYFDEAAAESDAGFYNTNSWEITYDGGIATEVFN
jgi:hypothetical protein